MSANALRRAVAFPFDVVALLMSLLGDALGILAAKIAGEDWPQQALHDSRKAVGGSSFCGLCCRPFWMDL